MARITDLLPNPSYGRTLFISRIVVSIEVAERQIGRREKSGLEPIENHFHLCKLCANLVASLEFLATIDNVLSITYTF